MNRKFPLTRKALEKWEKDKPQRIQMWRQASNDEEIDDATIKQDRAIRLVQSAFMQDTKTINSWSRVQWMSVESIQRIVNNAIRREKEHGEAGRSAEMRQA